MLTSRGGSQIISLYAYLLNQGIEGLVRSRKKIIGHAQILARYLRTSQYYQLVCDPEMSVVSWISKSRKKGAHWKIAEIINNSGDGCFIAYSPVMRIRTVHDRELFLKNTGPPFDGLLAHMMEHNTEKGIALLCHRLEKAARAI
jgi:hypothetical protein